MEEFYDFLCNAADIALAKHNPCGFDVSTGKCVSGKTNGCCTKCPHLTDTGCGVDSLACKLWVCHRGSDVMPELATIRNLASKSGLIPDHALWSYARLSKEEFFAFKNGKDVRSNRPDNRYC